MQTNDEICDNPSTNVYLNPSGNLYFRQNFYSDFINTQQTPYYLAVYKGESSLPCKVLGDSFDYNKACYFALKVDIFSCPSGYVTGDPYGTSLHFLTHVSRASFLSPSLPNAIWCPNFSSCRSLLRSSNGG